MDARPLSLNYHLLSSCNARCRFCFATFRDVDGQLSVDDAHRLVEVLRAAGGQKLTFAGGEPTLHPAIGQLVRHSKEAGFITCIVSNGACLGRLLDQHSGELDWVGLSIDSGDEEVQLELGRGAGDYIARAVALALRSRRLGIRIKLNTVVTALTWREDMSDLVRRVRPDRWKVFQALPITGQSDTAIDDLLVDEDQFGAFVDRHAHLAAEGFPPVVETNDAMLGSYVMVDPLGRFYGNTTGRHVYSDPILDVGVDVALSQVGFRPDKFEARGGMYQW